MRTNQQLQTLTQVKGLLSKDGVKARFADILGSKAAQFTASLINVVSSNDKLMECAPESIMSAALVAATYDLPIDGNLGFAAIVPYKNSVKDPATGQWVKVNVAQFQMMYKGFVQLAIRTGQYEKMHCAEVYQDEMRDWNPITGEFHFVPDFSQCKQRDAGQFDKVVGYYAYFRLLSGYTAELYMSKAQMQNHARRYSKSYQYDMNYGRQSSIWTTNFDAMAKKTVLKLLLSKWGILSVEVQRAIKDDQAVYDASGNGVYADNQAAFPVDGGGNPAISAPVMCEECGQAIQPTPQAGVDVIASYTRKHYGKALCPACKDRADAERKAAAKPVETPVDAPTPPEAQDTAPAQEAPHDEWEVGQQTEML